MRVRGAAQRWASSLPLPPPRCHRLRQSVGCSTKTSWRWVGPPALKFATRDCAGNRGTLALAGGAAAVALSATGGLPLYLRLPFALAAGFAALWWRLHRAAVAAATHAKEA